MGADGIRSVTRTLIDPETPRPRYVGFLDTAGYARGLDLGLEPGANYLVFGKRCFFGYVVHPDGDVWWGQSHELFRDGDVPARRSSTAPRPDAAARRRGPRGLPFGGPGRISGDQTSMG